MAYIVYCRRNQQASFVISPRPGNYMAYIVMAYKVMAYIAMVCIVMAYIVMACIVVTYTVMTVRTNRPVLAFLLIDAHACFMEWAMAYCGAFDGTFDGTFDGASNIRWEIR